MPRARLAAPSPSVSPAVSPPGSPSVSPPGSRFAGFSERTLRFLAELSEHNERDWFEQHRDDYETAVLQPAKALVTALGAKLRSLDPKIVAIPRELGSIKALERRRQYPGRRLPPYKAHLDLWFWSGARRAWDNAGFFLRLTPQQLTLAVGMIELQKATRARYCEQVLDEQRGSELAAIVERLRADQYVIVGETRKRTPPGVPADHPRAELLKRVGIVALWAGEHPPQLRAPDFVDFAFAHFERLAPLHAWLVAMRSG